MELKRIHHVAMTHPTGSPLLAALAGLCDLSADHIEAADGFIERMWGVGDGFVQTLEATGDGIIQQSLDTRGPGLHHIAFEVDDLDSALVELADAGVHLIDSIPRAGGAGTLIAFVHPSAFGGVLVELVEEPASH